MNKRKRITIIIIAILVAVAVAVCAVLLFKYNNTPSEQTGSEQVNNEGTNNKKPSNAGTQQPSEETKKPTTSNKKPSVGNDTQTGDKVPVVSDKRDDFDNPVEKAEAEKQAGTIKRLDVYQDGEQLSQTNGDKIDLAKDVKKLYVADEKMVVYDYANGFSVTLPSSLTPNYEYGRYVTRYESDEVVIVISYETQNSPSGDKYYDMTLYGGSVGQTFRDKNKIDLQEIKRFEKTKNGCIMDTFRAQKLDMGNDYYGNPYFNSYSYLYLRDKPESLHTFRILIKYKVGYRFANLEKMIRDSFKIITPSGRAANNAGLEYPVIPAYWNEETKAYYKFLCQTDTCQWGLMHNSTYGGMQRANFFERQTGAKTDIYKYYLDSYGLYFDEELAQKCVEQDKILFLHIVADQYSMNLLSGKMDTQLQELARKIKEFGHPIIFGFPAETNSNWGMNAVTSMMGDPDLIREFCMRIGDIFYEEGVDNVIFMTAPQSEQKQIYGLYNQKWLNKALYQPPKEYYQAQGVVTYDMGMEGVFEHDDFSIMLKRIAKVESEYYSNWPFIIEEFGAAGLENKVDKTRFINEMFDTVREIPNVKAAVWFDMPNFYSDGSIYRDFRLTVPLDAGLAFFNGIKNLKQTSSTANSWSYANFN